MHGIGNALFERMAFDTAAQPLTTTFADYLLPTSTDVPTLEVLLHESPSPFNPLGAKGVGEGGTVPVAAAVISAIEDALSPFGVRVAQAPISPAEIVQLLAAPGTTSRESPPRRASRAASATPATRGSRLPPE